MSEVLFFPKIARLSRDVVITEKLDGTNAGIGIGHYTENERGPYPLGAWFIPAETGGSYAMWALSRNRVLIPEANSGKKGSDNFGFAAWAYENRNELVKLGVGTNFGEWWGRGIQRGYGLQERRFSLFNTLRWVQPTNDPANRPNVAQSYAPACCHVVPVLYTGPFDTSYVDFAMYSLSENGSKAAPGFTDPEGIIVYHTAARVMFKKTFEKDAAGKEAA